MDNTLRVTDTAVKRVLIVDDEQDLTWSIVRRLSRSAEGFEFICAGSAAQALEVIHRQPIDLLVTDMRMPEMSGQELVRLVRSEYPSVKIILMSAFFRPDLKELMRHFQINGYIEKPFEMDDLCRLIFATA